MPHNNFEDVNIKIVIIFKTVENSELNFIIYLQKFFVKKNMQVHSNDHIYLLFLHFELKKLKSLSTILNVFIDLATKILLRFNILIVRFKF
jgi:hypothetical protein